MWKEVKTITRGDAAGDDCAPSIRTHPEENISFQPARLERPGFFSRLLSKTVSYKRCRAAGFRGWAEWEASWCGFVRTTA